MKAPDGREIFIWRGRDLTEDTRRLATTVADLCVTKLFLVDGALHWFDGGQPVVVSRGRLHEIITETVVTERLVERGPETWEVEFHPFDFAHGTDSTKGPDDRVLSSLMDELKLLVAKGPAKPLSQNQLNQARGRLAQGEGAQSIAFGLGVDIELVKKLRA